MKILIEIIGAVLISALWVGLIFRFADWLRLRLVNKKANLYIQKHKQKIKNNSVCNSNNR